MSIVELTQALIEDEHGIWASDSREPVSYPADGHSRCLQVEDRSFWFKHRNECIVAAIERHPPSGCILDVGGGNGFVARRILDAGFDCAVLEPGVEGALNAKRAREIPVVIRSTLENARFEPGTLASIGLFDVIEHVEEDRSMANSIGDLLRTGGLVYCTVPIYPLLWSKHDVKAGHFRRYRREELEALFSDRFELLYFSYLFSALVAPMFLFKALPFRLFGSRGKLSTQQEHATGGGPTASLLGALLRREALRIRRGLQTSMGTSALIVARKL